MIIENRIGKYLQSGRFWYQRQLSGIKVFSVHHSASIPLNKTNEEMLQELMNDHTKQGWPGMSYHFVITPDGSVFQINNFSDVTWVDSINWDCIGICLVGYFHEPYNEMPTNEQLLSLKALLDNLSTEHPEFPAVQSGTYGHRERFATACPGDLFFPFVLEYRNKVGQVDWAHQGVGAPTQEQPSPQAPETPPDPQEPSVPVVPPAPVTPDVPQPPAPTSPTLSAGEDQLVYTKAQYDDVVNRLQEKTQSLNALTTAHSAFAALGYNTIDDIEKALAAKDKDNRGLISQIVSLKEQLAKNHEEDFTALEMGSKAIDELKDLKIDWESMLVALSPSKPDITHVLIEIDRIKHISEVGKKILDDNSILRNESIAAVESRARQKLSSWVNQVIGFFTIIVFCISYTAFFLLVGR